MVEVGFLQRGQRLGALLSAPVLSTLSDSQITSLCNSSVAGQWGEVLTRALLQQRSNFVDNSRHDFETARKSVPGTVVDIGYDLFLHMDDDQCERFVDCCGATPMGPMLTMRDIFNKFYPNFRPKSEKTTAPQPFVVSQADATPRGAVSAPQTETANMSRLFQAAQSATTALRVALVAAPTTASKAFSSNVNVENEIDGIENKIDNAPQCENVDGGGTDVDDTEDDSDDTDGDELECESVHTAQEIAQHPQKTPVVTSQADATPHDTVSAPQTETANMFQLSQATQAAATAPQVELVAISTTVVESLVELKASSEALSSNETHQMRPVNNLPQAENTGEDDTPIEQLSQKWQEVETTLVRSRGTTLAGEPERLRYAEAMHLARSQCRASFGIIGLLWRDFLDLSEVDIREFYAQADLMPMSARLALCRILRDVHGLPLE